METENAQKRPNRSSEVLVNVEEGHVITALNAKTGKIFVINEVGKRILELSNGVKCVEDIVNVIAKEFAGADHLSISADVMKFLRECEKEDLIQWSI